MRARIQKVRSALFGVAVAGAMLFGGSQAVAAPAQARCDYPNVWLGEARCPTGTLCGQYCASGEGECGMGCCYCLL